MRIPAEIDAAITSATRNLEVMREQRPAEGRCARGRDASVDRRPSRTTQGHREGRIRS